MSSPATLYSLIRSHRPLGVWCKACGHATLVTLEQIRANERSEMSSLCQLRLKCSLCESHDWRGLVFNSHDQMTAWLSAPYEPAEIVATHRKG